MFLGGEHLASKLPLPLTCVYDRNFISFMKFIFSEPRLVSIYNLNPPEFPSTDWKSHHISEQLTRETSTRTT